VKRAGLALLVVLAVGCGRKAPPAPDSRVHTIVLPEMDAPVAEASGRATFEGACSSCHTLRYVAEQPPFPRRVWTAEVDKMRKVYGAPIPEERTKELVDYLVAVRGVGD
jgi:hypothetical protein